MSKLPGVESADDSYTIFIGKIECNDLKSVERFGGKNDPFVELEYAVDPKRPWMQKTTVLANQGSHAVWDKLEKKTWSITVNDKVVVEKALSIKVFDHNDILSNTLIGTAVTSLKDIVQTARDVEHVIELSLVDKANQKSGRITITFTHNKVLGPKKCDPIPCNVAQCCSWSLDFLADAIVAGLDYVGGDLDLEVFDSKSVYSFKSGILRISTIEVRNADAVEFTGKNDLFVTIMLSELNIRTTTQNDIGANAIWKLTEDNACKLSNEELGTATMRVEVWDENTMRKNTLIGTAPNVSISKLVGAVPGVDVQVSFDVLNGKGKKSGSVVVTMRMSN